MVWSAEDLGPIGVVTWLGFAGSQGDQWQWLGEGVAAVYAGHGGRPDRSCLVAKRSVALPRPSVVATSCSVRSW